MSRWMILPDTLIVQFYKFSAELGGLSSPVLQPGRAVRYHEQVAVEWQNANVNPHIWIASF